MRTTMDAKQRNISEEMSIVFGLCSFEEYVEAPASERSQIETAKYMGVSKMGNAIKTGVDTEEKKIGGVCNDKENKIGIEPTNNSTRNEELRPKVR